MRSSGRSFAGWIGSIAGPAGGSRHTWIKAYGDQGATDPHRPVTNHAEWRYPGQAGAVPSFAGIQPCPNIVRPRRAVGSTGLLPLNWKELFMDSKNPSPNPSPLWGAAATTPGPDALLGLWASWMEAASGSGQALGQTMGKTWPPPMAPWWPTVPDVALGNPLATGVKQFDEFLGKNSALRAIDQVWNANPLRDVVPVDWAEIAHALRTVWLRTLSDPAKAVSAAADLNARVFSAAADAWRDAAQRWLGAVTPGDGKPARSADKRFAAPEWQSNPAFRTLKEMYLLA